MSLKKKKHDILSKVSKIKNKALKKNVFNCCFTTVI